MIRRSWPAAGILLVCAIAHGQQPAEPPSVRALFANPAFASPAISEDGQTLAVIHSKGDLQFILIRPISGGDPKPVARLDDPDTRLAWLEWASSTRLLMSATRRNPNSVGMRSRVTRLFGVDADGKNFSWLGKRWPYLGQLQVQPFHQDQIVHWTPDDPDSVLIQVDSPYRGEWPRVHRMDVHSGALSPAQGPIPGVREWLADRNGSVRAGVGFKDDKYYELWTRIDPKSDFELSIRHDAFAHDEEFLGFHADDPAK